MASKPVRLTVEERQTIKDLHEQGVSKADIVRQTGRSIFIVAKVISGESTTKQEQKNEWRCKDCGTRFQGGYRLYCLHCAQPRIAAKRNRLRAVALYWKQQVSEASSRSGLGLDRWVQRVLKEGIQGGDADTQRRWRDCANGSDSDQ